MNLKEYPRIQWYYYCDNRKGNTVRLYDSEFFQKFRRLYVEQKNYDILRGTDLGDTDEALKQEFLSLLDERKDARKEGLSTNWPKKCLAYFEQKNNGEM